MWLLTTEKYIIGELIFSQANDHKEVSEQVDDIDVEVECREDVLLWTDGILLLPAHHQLRGRDQSILGVHFILHILFQILFFC